MTNEEKKNYIKELLEEGSISIVYPKEKGSEKQADDLMKTIDSAICVAEIKDEQGNISWGVLIKKEDSLDNKGELNDCQMQS